MRKSKKKLSFTWLHRRSFLVTCELEKPVCELVNFVSFENGNCLNNTHESVSEKSVVYLGYSSLL